MNDEQTAPARRAVACRGWKWMAGMLAALDGIGGDYRARVCRVEGDKFWSDATLLPYDLASYMPDLTDPATLGCLLALVREAWGMPTGITVSYSSDGGLWGVSWSGATHVGWCGRGVTEAEALVAALESVP